jgi:hypothetical protein
MNKVLKDLQKNLPLLKDRRLIWGAGIIASLLVAIYLISAVNYVAKCSPARKSCLEHRKAGCNITGDYNILVGSTESEATCDMDTEGGGWTLVANYLHKKGAPGKPRLLERGRFPIQNNTSLGYDEADDEEAWGHAGSATMMSIPFQEFRFLCQTSAHKRLVHFTMASEKCFNYLRTGKGACLDSPEDRKLLMTRTRGLANNDSRLPAVADKGWKEQGDNALTNYPFYTDYRHHWAIGALPGRYECDDYEPGGTTSTFHQVWVR